ncbi:hypothetical protein HHK36_020807 [Tetracentron sinense]|uniref:FLZ-type domain-containing protein n=1 Tax=Tetracentron sinense TaxID=13715 RepID=A0A835D8C0_TETSI|nr:hypothetical protein HHK36_020807 [Tetracentron sinense]
MVGLSIILEGQKSINKRPQVINRITMIESFPPLFSSSPSWSSSSPVPEITFLDACFLCRQRLLPGKDIYMYKGDRAFCSVECRYRQIYMDEEESVKREKCSFASMKPTSSSASRYRKGTRKRAGCREQELN